MPVCLWSLSAFESVLLWGHYQRRKVLIVCICLMKTNNSIWIWGAGKVQDDSAAMLWTCFRERGWSHAAHILTAHGLPKQALGSEVTLEVPTALHQGWSETAPTGAVVWVSGAALSLYPKAYPLTPYWSPEFYPEPLSTLGFKVPWVPRGEWSTPVPESGSASADCVLKESVSFSEPGSHLWNG